jgi:hypothetical protein
MFSLEISGKINMLPHASFLRKQSRKLLFAELVILGLGLVLLQVGFMIHNGEFVFQSGPTLLSAGAAVLGLIALVECIASCYKPSTASV